MLGGKQNGEVENGLKLSKSYTAVISKQVNFRDVPDPVTDIR